MHLDVRHLRAPRSIALRDLIGRYALAACVLLGLVSLGANLWFGPQLDARGVSVLSLLIGALALAGGLAGTGQSRAPLASRPEVAGIAELNGAIADMRQLLTDERREAAALRDTASHEATKLTNRLAGVALDVESRLTGSVSRAEQALQSPAGAMARAAAAVRRVEQAVSELTALIRGGPAGLSPEVPMDLSWAGNTGSADAHPVIAGITKAADQLRHDAQALDIAAREIAIAGAGVVRQLGDTATQMQAALTDIPLITRDLIDSAEAASANLRGNAADAVVQIAEALLHAARSSEALLGRLQEGGRIQA